jgi:hypothetical protein
VTTGSGGGGNNARKRRIQRRTRLRVPKFEYEYRPERQLESTR